MADPQAVTLLAATAETVTGQGASVDITGGARSVLDLAIRVGTVSGTSPVLQVMVQTSADATTWREIGALGQDVMAPGSWRLLVDDCDRYVRAAWVISGTTPSFTLSLAGSSHVVYANRRDLQQSGMSSDALVGIPEQDKILALLSASDEATTVLSRHYSLPLQSWGNDLTTHVARMAAYHIAMVTRTNYDEWIAEGYTNSLKALRGARDVSTIIDSTPTYDQDAAEAYSDDSRGW